MSGEPKTLTLTEAVMQLGWTGKALHFDPYAGAWLVLRESGQIGARGATWPEAVSDALGGTVVPVDEATEVRLAAKKLLAELSKLAEAYVFEVQHGAVPDAMEALEAALGVPVVARDEANDDLTTAYLAGLEKGRDAARDEAAELRAAVREYLEAGDTARAAVSMRSVTDDEFDDLLKRKDAAFAALRRLAGGESER